MLTGLPIGLPFSRNLAGGWLPTDASANTLQWLHDIDTAGSPWLVDKSQTGDDRILSGGPGLQRGRAVDFNGSSQYINTGQDPVFGSAVSVFGWIKTTGTSGALASHYDGADRSWLINVHTSGHVRVLLSDDGTFPGASGKNYETTESVNDGAWHHIGFTFSDSTLKIYIDGSEVSPTKSVDNAMSTLYNPPDNVLLGAMDSGAAQLLNGGLFGVVVFSDGLTANEVSWLYSFGESGVDPTMANCLGYYKLDEQSGSTAYDSSGNGNDGTYVSSPTHTTQDVYSWQNSVGYRLNGAVFVPRDESDTANDVTGTALDYSGSAPRHAKLIGNNCVSLNGSNQYVTVPDHSTLDIAAGNALTLATWVNFTATGSYYLIDKQQGTTGGYYLRVTASAIVVGLIDGSSYNEQSYSYSFSTATDYHIAVTFDGDQARFYVDGVLEHTTASLGITLADSTTAVNVGRWSAGGLYVNGKLWDVRIADTALSTANIQSLAQIGGTAPTLSDLVLWLPLAEGANSTAYDVSGNNNDGTYTNTPTHSTQDTFAYNTAYGFRLASGVYIPADADGVLAADGNAITNAAVDGHNGSEAHINFNPYTIPALDSGNTDGYTVPTDWDVFEDDLKTPAQHWALRVDQETDFSEFFLYDDELTGADWDNAHAYVKTVSQLNSLLEHYWSMDALAGSGGQTTDDEINSLTLTGGSMDAETTVTPAQRGNAINIPDTGGSTDGTLSAAAPANLNLNKAVSHFGWVKIRTAPSTAECMILDQNTGNSRVVITNSTNYARWTYNSQVITDNVALNDSAFHFYVAARDVNGNLTLWVDGRWVGKQTGVTMLTGTGTLKFCEDGDMGLADIDLDEHGATDTNKLRDNHVGFLAAGKYLNKTTNQFEA